MLKDFPPPLYVVIPASPASTPAHVVYDLAPPSEPLSGKLVYFSAGRSVTSVRFIRNGQPDVVLNLGDEERAPEEPPSPCPFCGCPVMPDADGYTDAAHGSCIDAEGSYEGCGDAREQEETP